jgi:rod shape determining protein RodA
MYRETNRHFRFDWMTIILFLLLVGFGWLNILSASHIGETVDYFDFSQPYGKQLVFIILTFFKFNIFSFHAVAYWFVLIW